MTQTAAPDLNYYLAIAAAQHERDAEAQRNAAIEKERARRERFERERDRILQVLGLDLALKGWDIVDPGEYQGTYSNRYAWPDVVFRRIFFDGSFDRLLVEIGARMHGYPVMALLFRDGSGWWGEAVHNDASWISGDWPEPDKLTFFALTVEEAVEHAKARAERANLDAIRRPKEPLPQPCQHDWHAVLARKCFACSAVEAESIHDD